MMIKKNKKGKSTAIALKILETIDIISKEDKNKEWTDRYGDEIPKRLLQAIHISTDHEGVHSANRKRNIRDYRP